MSVSLNVQFRIGTLLKAEKKNVHAHKTRSFQQVPPPFLSGSPPLLGVFVHEWESAKRNLNLNLLTVWFEVIFLSIKSLSGQVVHRAGVYSGFLCFKRPGVFVLPEWNAYRKREGDLKYVTDLIVAFNLLGKRKQLSESYILQNATIICFGCHCSAFNFWYNWNKISSLLWRTCYPVSELLPNLSTNLCQKKSFNGLHISVHLREWLKTQQAFKCSRTWMRSVSYGRGTSATGKTTLQHN